VDRPEDEEEQSSNQTRPGLEHLRSYTTRRAKSWRISDPKPAQAAPAFWSVGRWLTLGVVIAFLVGTMVVVFNVWMDNTLVGVSSIAALGGSTTTTQGIVPASPGQKVRVVIQGLNLRTQPSSGGGVIIRKLPAGMVLDLVARTQGWFNVKTSDGTVGWVVDRQGYSALQ
jgi:hypothetical protein